MEQSTATDFAVQTFLLLSCMISATLKLSSLCPRDSCYPFIERVVVRVCERLAGRDKVKFERLFYFALAIILFSTFNSAASAAETECWELIQTSLIAGKHRITVSPKAFKIQSIGNRYCIIAKAPDWKVAVFNRHAKTIYETPAQGFKGNLSAGTGAFGGYLENLPILRRPKVKDTVMHLPALVMHVDNPTKVKRSNKRSMGYSGVSLNTGDVASADYWMWDNPRLPPAFQLVINKLYRFPIGAMPLKFITINADRETNTEVETLSVRQIPYDEKTFDLPKNFKVVKDELAIVNDSSRNTQVKNLIQNWDNWGKIVETGK